MALIIQTKYFPFTRPDTKPYWATGAQIIRKTLASCSLNLLTLLLVLLDILWPNTIRRLFGIREEVFSVKTRTTVLSWLRAFCEVVKVVEVFKFDNLSRLSRLSRLLRFSLTTCQGCQGCRGCQGFQGLPWDGGDREERQTGGVQLQQEVQVS